MYARRAGGVPVSARQRASETAVRGGGRCPKCASRRVATIPVPPTEFYATTLEACLNCKSVWEPIDPAQIWDPDDPLCSFREPCGNCAFRPGSPEQADTAKWRELIASLRNGASFHCHKGVPIDPTDENGFAYPKNKAKLRLCRGFLDMWGRTIAKASVEDVP